MSRLGNLPAELVEYVEHPRKLWVDTAQRGAEIGVLSGSREEVSTPLVQRDFDTGSM